MRESTMFLLAHGPAGTTDAGPFLPWEWHPATVHFPIALLLGGVALDLYAWANGRSDLARTATGLIAAGTLLGLAAATTGVVAFFTVPAHTEEAHALMYWHMGLNGGALGLSAAAFFLRRRAAVPGTGARFAGLVAAALLAAGGFLGGRIVYRGGAGVDPAILSPEVRGGHTHGEPAVPQPGPAGGRPGAENPPPPAPTEPHRH